MSTKHPSIETLLTENAELRARLEEAEETLCAIRSGKVDALVVEGFTGPQIFALQGLDAELNRFRGEILEQINDAVIVLDEDRITYLNMFAGQQYGVSIANMLGHHIKEMYQTRWIHPEDEINSTAALAETGRWVGENIHIKRNGEGINVEISLSRLHSNSGVLVVIRDITERKLAEQVTKDANRRKDEFLAMLAHELRNPLAPIRNAVEIQKLAHSEPSRLAWCNDVIERHVEHLTRLVDDLLDVSRISRGLVELKKEPLEIRNFIQPAVETCQPLIDARRHKFAMTLPPEPLWVEGDQIRLAQVVSNLINNAAKYTDEGGHIDLSVEPARDEVCIRISDNGCGINPADLPCLFDLFYQVDRHLDRSQGGLGIGLSLVHSLVAEHGGQVRVISAGPGQGSEFEVRLPRLILPEPAAVGCSSRPAQNIGKLRIIVVDDNRDAAESLALLLEIDGHQVQMANDGPAAHEMAQAAGADVIILDIGLPGMDGYSVAQALRRRRELDRTMLIALTGYGLPDDREKSRAAGFDAHMVKPIDFEMLRKLLAEHIKLRESQGSPVTHSPRT